MDVTPPEKMVECLNRLSSDREFFTLDDIRECMELSYEEILLMMKEGVLRSQCRAGVTVVSFESLERYLDREKRAEEFLQALFSDRSLLQ